MCARHVFTEYGIVSERRIAPAKKKDGGAEIDERERVLASLTSRQRARVFLVTIDIGDDDREDESKRTGHRDSIHM